MKYQPNLIVAFTTILCFLIASPATAQITRIQVGYSSIGVGQSLVWVANEAGLFKENGLDVHLIFIGSSSILTQSVIAGDVPIAIMSGTAAINSQLAGSDVVMAASTKKDPAQAFLVTAKGISQPAQLKGKKLAVSRLGASSDFILRLILKKIGLVPDKDVAIIQIGSSPVRMAALSNGVADGTALTFEEMMVAKKMGFNVMLNIMEFGVESLNSDVVTTRRYIRESRETVRRVHQRNDQGCKFLWSEQEIFHGCYRTLHEEQRYREDRIWLRLRSQNLS
jgi:NitT/TauT family transport system substrate-binding protein